MKERIEMLTFDKEKHQYYQDGAPVVSVTQLLAKHGLAPDYSHVNRKLLEARAERGDRMHAEVEAYFRGEALPEDEPTTLEGESAKRWLSTQTVTDVSTERMVGNDIVAGTYDILATIGGEVTLIDVKTTSTRQADYWAWQLSLYRKLLREQGIEVQNMGDLWLHDGVAEWCMTLGKPDEEVEKLLDCERSGCLYLQQLDTDSSELVARVSEQAIEIMKAEDFIKNTKAMMQEGLDALMAEMERRGAKSVEGHGIRVTYVAPSRRTTFDAKKFKADHPDYDGRYDKTSEVKASLRLARL